MTPIELENSITDDSRFTTSDEEDKEITELRKPIDSVNDLLKILGAEVESESSEEILINITSKSISIPVPKTIFKEFCSNCAIKREQVIEIENLSKKTSNDSDAKPAPDTVRSPIFVSSIFICLIF